MLQSALFHCQNPKTFHPLWYLNSLAFSPMLSFLQLTNCTVLSLSYEMDELLRWLCFLGNIINALAVVVS